MDIKERFYANLNMLREESEQKSKGRKTKKRPLPPMTREMEKDKSIPGSLASYRDRIYQARKKQLRKKAVTGMDEEAEHLDEAENDVVDHKAPGIKKLKDGKYWAKSQAGTMKIFNDKESAVAHSKKNK